MQICAIGIERATVVLAVAGHIQAWSQFHFEACLIKARPVFFPKRTRGAPYFSRLGVLGSQFISRWDCTSLNSSEYMLVRLTVIDNFPP